jgi:hypothetical protein
MGSSGAVICTYTHLTMQLDMHPCAPRHKNGNTASMFVHLCTRSSSPSPYGCKQSHVHVHLHCGLRESCDVYVSMSEICVGSIYIISLGYIRICMPHL